MIIFKGNLLSIEEWFFVVMNNYRVFNRQSKGKALYL